MQRRFVTVDVFTEQQFGGNPLAVVLDPEGLSAAQMQQIAAEFNLSETTFVFPPKDPRHTADVRIFTPRAEIPFAGHPNIGTAYALAQLGECHGREVGDMLQFEELAGVATLTLERDETEAVVGARLTAPQAFQRLEDISPALAAAVGGLEPDDIDVNAHEPCIASAGMPFLFTPLKHPRAPCGREPANSGYRPASTDGQSHRGIFLCTRRGIPARLSGPHVCAAAWYRRGSGDR